MPPVKWQLLAVLAACIICAARGTKEAKYLHDSISMTEDGWRPIVGNQRDSQHQSEIKYYRNPSHLEETVKAEPVSSTPPSTTTRSASSKPTLKPELMKKVITNVPGQIIREKVAPHSKIPFGNQFFVLPNHGSHGPHIPLGQNFQHMKSPGASKLHTYISNGKRHIKPVRVPVGAHSTRDEVYVPAPSAGTFGFFGKPQSTIKIRETPGLGIAGVPTKQYHFHPHSHFDLGTSFQAPSVGNNFFSQYSTLPAQNFAAFKQQISEPHLSSPFQNDFLTGSLVPPPYKLQQESGKTKTKPIGYLVKDANEFASLSSKPIVQHASYVPQDIDLHPPAPPTTAATTTTTEEAKQEFYITKEKKPPNQYREVNRPSEPQFQLPAYEVTEGKFWQDNPSFFPQVPTHLPKIQIESSPPQIKPSPPVDSQAFLPTPFKPESLPPTSPTQSEVSTVFTKLSLKQKQKAAVQDAQMFFDVKEVSTHYPILGNPDQFEINKKPVISNEIAASEKPTKEVSIKETVEPTVEPQRTKQRRRRPGHRLRTTTEEPTTTAVSDEGDKTTEGRPTLKPYRQRRPIRYRTTTQATVRETPSSLNREIYRKRPNRLRLPSSQNVETEQTEAPQNIDRSSEMSEDYDGQYNSIKTSEPIETEQDHFNDRRPYSSDYSEAEQNPTTSQAPEEAEVSTERWVPEIVTEKAEEPETTLATTTVSTTTTTEPTTTKSHRIRGRPNKYDASNRPRFSVKDYRQRLSQHSTTTSTTEAPKSGASSSPRFRFPSRFRRPTTSTTPQTEDFNESMKIKQKSDTEANNSIITDKPVRAINTRLRPFGRQRSTTEASSTQRASIRPSIYSSLKRPTPISLRKRIYERQRNNTAETTTEPPEAEEVEENEALSEVVETTVPFSQTESPMEFDSKKMSTESIESVKVEEDEESEEEEEQVTDNDVLRSDTFLQRVSDLTSSAKKEYDTPGLFKNVPSSSRRVPSYFTIATEDPILPIETVFANIKEKDKS